MHPTFSTRGHRPKSHVTNPPGRRLCIAHTPALLKRPGITGARWGLDGAEAILTLRAVISNGDFEEYWPFHLAREHQRLYPGTAQGRYTLGA